MYLEVVSSLRRYMLEIQQKEDGTDICLFLFYVCVYECFAHKHHVHAWWPQIPKEGIESPGT